MKLLTASVLAGLAFMAAATVQGAENVCYFRPNATDKAMRAAKFLIPDTVRLQRAAVGSVMATVDLTNPLANNRIMCGNFGARYGHSILDAAPVPGFDRVFQTGVQGVGVRIIDVASYFYGPVPFESASVILQEQIPKRYRLEFVRTERDVAEGSSSMNMRFRFWIGQGVGAPDQWEAIEYSFTPTRFENLVFFNGCAGIKSQEVALGKVATAELGKVPAKSFNLDAVCSGMAAGTKLPVKVYFEGRTTGGGRLLLDPGGAQGINIALTTDGGVPIPFIKGLAMDMTWMNSLPDGELYRYPIHAVYTRAPGSSPIVVGPANATLNYVLEYN